MEKMISKTKYKTSSFIDRITRGLDKEELLIEEYEKSKDIVYIETAAAAVGEPIENINNLPLVKDNKLYWISVEENEVGFNSATYYTESGSIELSKAIVIYISSLRKNKNRSRHIKQLYELGWISSPKNMLDIIEAYKLSKNMPKP